MSRSAYSETAVFDGITYQDCEKNFSWIAKDKIGRGNFGTVKAACRKDNPDDCQYVAKIIKQDFIEDYEVEVAILRHLNGSWISPVIYDYFECKIKEKAFIHSTVERIINVIIMERFDETFLDVLNENYLQQLKEKFSNVEDLIDYYEDAVKERVYNEFPVNKLEKMAKLKPVIEYFKIFRSDPNKLTGSVVKQWIYSLRKDARSFEVDSFSVRYLSKITHDRPIIEIDKLNLTKKLQEQLAKIGVLLEGLSKNKIISRDMKPDNILHKKNAGQFALSDFGSAYWDGNEKFKSRRFASYWQWNFSAPVYNEKSPFENEDYLFDTVSLEVMLKNTYKLDYKFPFVEQGIRDKILKKYGL